VFVDPLVSGKGFSKIEVQAEFAIDDSMIIPPSARSGEVEISRGPNIGQPPKNTALPDKLSGECGIKVADKITTDHIMPAGARLKYRSNIKKYSEFVFEGVDGTFSKRPQSSGTGIGCFCGRGRQLWTGVQQGNMPLCAPCTWG
jgi:aconitate hydratase